MKTKSQRQEEAQLRQESRNKRNNTQQIAKLDSLLGKGIGAKKERLKLVQVNVK